MRAFLAIGTFWLAGLLAVAGAAEPTRAEAINQAGRQRMLTQRIVKSYCQIGLGVNPEASRARLAEAARQFELQLERLRPFAPDPAVGAALRELERLWRPFQSVAAAPVTRDGAQTLRDRSVPLLAAAENLVAVLERGGAGTTGRLVNLAGGQRMLSQQLAKTYMLFTWGLDDAPVRGEMRAATAEFGAAMELLRSAPQNDDALRIELEAASLQWEWLLGALAQYDTTAYPLIVDDASEAILQRMERVTRLYEALGGR